MQSQQTHCIQNNIASRQCALQHYVLSFDMRTLFGRRLTYSAGWQAPFSPNRGQADNKGLLRVIRHLALLAYPLLSLRTAAYQRGNTWARRSSSRGGENGRPRPSSINPAAPPSTSSVISRLRLRVRPELSLIVTLAFCPVGKSITASEPVATDFCTSRSSVCTSTSIALESRVLPSRVMAVPRFKRPPVSKICTTARG